MFKDSLSNSGQFAKENVYARWRILEARCDEAEAGHKLKLNLEVLPLDGKLESKKAELLAKYNSSSNLAISLLEIPLKWRSPDVKKRLFTSPCLVLSDTQDSVVTDSMVRLGMATVRDLLGRLLQVWKKARQLFTIRKYFIFGEDAVGSYSWQNLMHLRSWKKVNTILLFMKFGGTTWFNNS